MAYKKLTKVVVNGLLSSTLVLTMGTGAVFANETDSETAVVETVETSSVQTENESIQENEGNDTTSQQSIESNVTGEEQIEFELEELDSPSLIPGDFFYFVKMVAEKIRLAVTFDEYKEAQLLANYAAERIAEANALIAQGKVEKAEQLLKDAISIQELASELLPSNEVETEEVVEETASEVEATETATTEEVEPTEVASETVEEVDGTETDTEVESTEEEQTDETIGEIEHKLANNIDALLMVLAKIDNPKAQAAIMKNIQKSFAKLEKKIKKMEEAELKFAEKMTEIEYKVEIGQISEVEAAKETAKLEVELINKIEKIEDEEEKDVEEVNNEVEKETTEATNETVKQEREENREVEKQQREEAKRIAEQQREEAKRVAEQQREEAKRIAEQQREQAKKAAEQKREQAKGKDKQQEEK
ncbi:DUF5667 domain-containing protein [Bacillus sp. Marseille-P3661]|uniref:DUF5667 domain-containing protein n=1 Tax=Bacillus sp. Marseille-P3661 TaxID=1936234 RepID=UPI000C84B22C|nr:DUF5667 domain-containing protein [Bacillus sp. Marseille-P3661]